MNNNKLDIKALESWLWDTACKIRGEIDVPKYKDYFIATKYFGKQTDLEFIRDNSVFLN